MKRFAIFCDGTWNRPNAAKTTNVYQLYRATRRVGPDGVVQLPAYVPGVGTGYGLSGAAKAADVVLGGLFGVGVMRNIKRAYRFLAEHYAPGDEIYIFGFSRGAYTARSLAGMIRASGFPGKGRAHEVDRAFKRYRNRSADTKPDTEESRRFRLDYSPDYATSDSDLEWRRSKSRPAATLVAITYLGIWDTVGQLGVPGNYHVLAWLVNGRHQFHDTKLSSSVMAARHAVSIDEIRKAYPPTLWSNLGDLNLREQFRSGQYAQRWFPGDHGSIGGGGDILGLSNITLKWIADGAAEQGLAISPLNDAFEDVTAPLINKSGRPDLITRWMRMNKLDRVAEYGPIQSWEISKAASLRHEVDPSYRPELF